MPERSAYFCGKWIPESQLAIAVDDLGFTMGITATERLRTFGGKLFRKEIHLSRLQRSLAILGLPSQSLREEISQAMDQLLDSHQVAEASKQGTDWGVTTFVTPGRGDGPTVALHGGPLPFGDWASLYAEGVRTTVSQYRQVPPSSWPAELKCRSRMHYYLADNEAAASDRLARALLLDYEGFVAEASTANLVVYSQANGLRTPRFSKVLHGVSVAVVEELAQQLGVPFSESDLSVEQLMAADEVWLTSTSICLQPVVSCDGQPIGTGSHLGKPGPEYARFLAAWSEQVGLDIAKQACHQAEISA